MIDWNIVWKNQMLTLKRLVTLQTEFWDYVAGRKNEDVLSMADLTSKQLEKIKVDPEDTLLEIGPEHGRLTIPLAKAVKAVMAVEPSRKMLTILRGNACTHSVKNISYINKRWEGVEIGKDVNKHDVVIASFSLLVADLKVAIEKIDLAATKAAYLFFSAESRMPEDIQRLVFGERFTILSDHIIAYNLIYSLGIAANVEIIKYESKRSFTTINEAVRELVEVYAFLTQTSRRLSEKFADRGVGRILCKRRKKAAVIWWTK